MVLVGVAWIVAMVMPLTSNAFWPVAVAPELIEQRSTRFAVDPISVLPLRDREWVVQPWIPTLAMYGSFDQLGLAGLSILQGLLAALIALLVYRLARANAAGLPAAVASLASMVLMLPGVLRTEQFALVIGAALLIVVRGRWWATAPLLIALWANVHGSVPLALVIVFGAALGLIRCPTPAGEPASMPLLATTGPVRVMWLAACVGAILASPLGSGILDYVASVRDVPAIEQITPVWRGLDSLGAGVVLLAILVSIGLAHARAMHPRRLLDGATWCMGAGLLPVLPVLVLAAATLDASRYSSWLALVVAVELGYALDWWFRRAGWARELRSPTMAIALLVPAVMGVAILVPGTPTQTRLASAGLPTSELVDGVDSRDVVLASAEWADYVHVRTGASVVIDARLERYRHRDLRDYVSFLRTGDSDVVRTADADVVILRRDGAGAVWRRLADGQTLDGVTYDRVRVTRRGLHYSTRRP